MSNPYPRPKRTKPSSKSFGNNDERVAEPALYRATIKDWPEEERPREKLAALGAGALTDSELIAILLRTGGRGKTALDLAKDLLSREGSLNAIGEMDLATLRQRGIGPARATSIVAAFELSRRLEREEKKQRPVFQTPDDVAGFFSSSLRSLKHEEFHALLLNASNRLLREVLITKGILNSSLVHPRECFTDAIREKAQSVIFVHNHPSGNPEPSSEDLAVTKQLVESGRILGIPVHDHIIIAGTSYTSFAERNLL